jgi:phosphoribosyl-AMP cyclohydrolase
MQELDFEKHNGLVPVVVVDDNQGDVLMLGFMNAEALELTQKTGYLVFFSRTRQRIWKRVGPEGDRLRIVSLATDCDRDTLLARVKVEGAGLVCHLGTRSCFTAPFPFRDSRGIERG